MTNHELAAKAAEHFAALVENQLERASSSPPSWPCASASSAPPAPSPGRKTRRRARTLPPFPTV